MNPNANTTIPAGANMSTPGTTSFQDTTKVLQDVTRDHPVTKTFGPQPTEFMNIEDFLRKPDLVKQGEVSTTDAAGTLLYSDDIADILEGNSLWVQKIEGYNLVRATAVIRVVINPNAFQACRLLLHFLPFRKEFAAYSTAYESMHNANLCAMTQQHCVEIDASDAAVEMRIPYIAPTNFYNRTTGFCDWGAIYLRVLSPLVTGTGGETSFEYSVFVYFEDVELSAPIIKPESGSSKSVTAFKVPRTNLATSNVGSATAMYKNFSFDMDKGGIRLKAPGVEARLQVPSFLRKESEGSGPISSVLNKVHDVASAVGTVPFLAPAAAAVGSAARIGSSIAKLFGWSKPLATSGLQYIVDHPFKYQNNADGVAGADAFGLTPNALIEPVGGIFGSDFDEMSFEYLKKIPALVHTDTWSVNDVHGTSVYEMVVGVNTGMYGTTVQSTHTAAWVVYPPYAYVASVFDMWRGGIDVTVKFVKTAYHTGRLMATLYPNNDVGTTNVSSQYVYREIIDISNTNEITLRIPYLHNTHYLPNDANTFDVMNSLGTLKFTVLNELRAPETCSSTVQMLFYLSAAPDFEVAFPTGHYKTPFNPIVLESGVRSIFEDAMPGKTIGSAANEPLNEKYNDTSIGDRFVSLKQLYNCARKFRANLANPSTNAITIYPWSFGTAEIKADNNLNTGGLWGDYISFFAPLYALHRGGIRLMNSDIGNSSNSFNVWIPSSSAQVISNDSLSADVNWNITPLVSGLKNGRITQFRAQAAGAMDIICPYFGKTPTRLNYLQTGAKTTVPVTEDRGVYCLNVTGGFLTDGKFMRSGADDFHTGYFVGCVPLLASYTDT